MVAYPTTPIPAKTEYKAVVIASGASLTEAIDIKGWTLVAIQMPASWTAANLTFQGAADGATFADIYEESGGERVVTAAASRFIALLPQAWANLQHFKVRSGTTGTPVNQGADRTLTLVLRQIDA